MEWRKKAKGKKKNSRRITRNREEPNISSLLFSIFAYALIGTDEIVPVWTALETPMGGLNFTTEDIGIMTGGVAPISFLFNLYVAPWIINKLVSVFKNESWYNLQL